MVLQGKSNINAKINNEEETECHMSGKLASKDIFEAFIQSCDNLHQLGEFESILHAAVKYHDFEFVKLFLETIVVDINAKDDCGNAPLQYAIFRRNESIVKILVEHGADIHLEDENGKSPLELALQLKLDNIYKILIIHGADKNELYDLMHEAVSDGDVEIFELLINEQTDLNHKNSSGKTMLYTASKEDYESIVQILLTKGADPNVVRDNPLDTPLHIASYFGHSDIVQLLLKNTQINWVE